VTALATDNFNRANGGLGANWTDLSSVSETFQVTSNKAVPTSLTGTDSGARYSGRTWTADQYSRAALSCTDTEAADGQAGPGVAVRCSGTSGASRIWYRVCVQHSATLNVSLSKHIGGTYTPLVTWTQAWTNGDVWELKVEGTTLTVTHVTSATVVGTYTDSSISTGQPGIQFSTDTNVTAASVDDWEGGDTTASITHVQGSGKLETSSGVPLSWTPGTTPVVGNLLTCRVVGWTSGGMTFVAANVKDSSSTPKTFNLDVQRSDGGIHFSGSAVFSLIVPSGLTMPLLVTSSSSGDARIAVFDEWTGNATSAVLDATNSNQDGGSGSSSMSTGTINTGATCGLILAATSFNISSSAAGITTTGSGFTQDIVENDSNSYEGASCDSRLVSPASQSGLQDTWTASAGSASWGAVIASYKVPVASPANPDLISILVHRAQSRWTSGRRWAEDR
jgi:hypothetical protein